MKARSYVTDLGEVLIHFPQVSTICRQPNRSKPGNNVLVQMANGSRYFLHEPDGDQLFRDYREWLEAN